MKKTFVDYKTGLRDPLVVIFWFNSPIEPKLAAYKHQVESNTFQIYFYKKNGNSCNFSKQKGLLLVPVLLKLSNMKVN